MIRYTHDKFLKNLTTVIIFRNYNIESLYTLCVLLSTIIFEMGSHKDMYASGWSNELLPYMEKYEGALPASQIILGIIGIAGIISVAVLAPNAMRILKFIEPQRWEKKKQKYRINEVVKRLAREGMVVIKEENDAEPCIQLTEKGIQRFQRFQNKIGSTQTKEWDEKWRVIIFDILEKRRKIRDRLRVELAHIGFRKLQNSVWVYPHDCEELIALLKVDLTLGRDVLYFVTEKMEGDAYLRRLFSLPKQA